MGSLPANSRVSASCVFEARSHPVSGPTTYHSNPRGQRSRASASPYDRRQMIAAPARPALPRSEAVGFGDLAGGGRGRGGPPVAEDEDEEERVRVEDELGLH